jgi:hypothetical protein
MRLHARAVIRDRPARVNGAVTALWAAWTVSAVALFVNQVVFHGLGIGPGPSLGVLSLAIQAVTFWFVRRGSSIARSFVILILVLAALPLAMLPRLFAERAVYSAGYLVLGFALKAVGVWLLFTGDAGEWFDAAPGLHRN